VPIEGTKLTSRGVRPGATWICLDFIAIYGGRQGIVLPGDTLFGLRMTLPCMQKSALDERLPGGSVRIVQRLGK
jgi:hypothetical protein